MVMKESLWYILKAGRRRFVCSFKIMGSNGSIMHALEHGQQDCMS